MALLRWLQCLRQRPTIKEQTGGKHSTDRAVASERAVAVVIDCRKAWRHVTSRRHWVVNSSSLVYRRHWTLSDWPYHTVIRQSLNADQSSIVSLGFRETYRRSLICPAACRIIVTTSNREKTSCHVSSQVQILAYNSDLYGNMTQAIQSSNGLVMLALLVRVITGLLAQCVAFDYQTN